MLWLLYKKLKRWSDVQLNRLIAAGEYLLFSLKIIQGG
jgi:hypothetical protein